MSWPTVAFWLGLNLVALGWGVAYLVMRTRTAETVPDAVFQKHVETFSAFTAAMEAKVAQLEDGVRKAQALQATLAGHSRFPPGLRGVGP